MTCFISAALIVCGFAIADDHAEDRALLAQAARSRAAAPTAGVERHSVEADPRDTKAASADSADSLARAAAQARFDVNLANARLLLVEARQALEAENFSTAAGKARAALKAFKSLSHAADLSVFELQAEGVLARAERGGAPPDLAPSDAADAQPNPSAAPATLAQVPSSAESDPDAATMAPDSQFDASLDAAQRIARHYSGADTRDVDTRGDRDALANRARSKQRPHKHYGYRPAQEIIDVDALLARDRERYFYERALHLAYADSEVNRLIEADEARVAPSGDISYPDDWPQRIARREKYKGGVIARSPSWTDNDGREWYLAVYDINDLIYEVPDFHPRHNLDPYDSLQSTLNLDALRRHSEIFSGYADDLAAGIPLLRYFAGGGIDDLDFRGPKYNLAKQREIVELINKFVGGASTTQSGP